MIPLLRTALFSLLALGFQAGFANNVRLSEGKLLPDMQTIQIRISWDNAWNLPVTPPYNHDAVWLFFKLSGGGPPFAHLDLSPNAEDHRVQRTSPLIIETVPDGKGVFVRLNEEYVGSADIANATLHLRLRENLGNQWQLEFAAFAVEMVHVPYGAFYLGDSQSNHTFSRGDGSGPFLITSENGIGTGTGTNMLRDTGQYAPKSTIPTDYPKGFAAFYCMKYELSQAQYRDFLNTLSYEQQAARTALPPTQDAGTLALSGALAARNGIRIQSPSYDGSYPALYGNDLQPDSNWDGPADGQNRACNWLSWDDLTAWLDWAALRPMTEMEYEKAARGPLPALPLEFAWGTDEALDANTVVDDGRASETVTEIVSGNQGLASLGYDGPQGPLRCGFAAGVATGRKAAGASYFGIMELSGNLWEQCVTVNAEGLAYLRVTGDGELSADGKADASTWPTASGAGYRGGGWNSGIGPGFRDLAISDRFYAGLPPENRRNTSGGRGVR